MSILPDWDALVAGRFTLPANGDPYQWDKLYQIGAAANGLTGWGRIWNLASLDDDSNYLLTLRNLGTGGHVKVLRSTDGAALLTMTDSGLTVTDVTITGGLTVNNNLVVKGNASIGDAAGDAHVIKGTVNVQHAADFDSTVNVDGAVTLGTTLNVTGLSTLADLTVGGNITVTGSARRFLADFTNATLANRTMFQTSTGNSDTNIIALPNGAGTTGSWIAANNSTVSSGQGLQLRGTTTRHRLASVDLGAGSTLPIGVYFGATQRFGFETTGDVVLVTNNVAYQVTESGGTVRDAVKLNASNVLLLGNATSRLTVSSPLTNNAKLTGSNAAGSATIDLIGTNASDQIDVGVAGTRANLLGTVVAPSIDPPTVNGQVTTGSVAAAWAHFTVSGGAITWRDSYNVDTGASTYNGAGDYSIVWDRNFSSAYYAVVVTVEDNGGVLLAPKINGQIAGSADIWVYNAAAGKTDPDAVSVIAFGTLS